MKRLGTIAGAVMALTVCGGSAMGGPQPSEATARTLVGQCGNIKEGELVLITGRPTDMDLLESIAVNVRKMGAFPIISVGTDRMTRRMWDEVPSKFDAQNNEMDMKLAGILNAIISVESTENPALLADISPDRMAARGKAQEAAMQASLNRNVKQVSLGNGMFPTDATAQMYGMDRGALAEVFWSGVNTDYNALQNSGMRVKTAIESAKNVHITNPNGTDITFRVQGRPVFVSDGVISKDDMNKGGAACQVWLPAGEVYSAPVPGTATGKVVIDRMFHQGREINNITLTFQNGKLTSMTAPSGLEPIRALYDAAGPGKDEFAFFDIGINPGVRVPQGSKLLSWVPAGMVTIGVGTNTWAGGTNACGYSLSGFLPGSTVMVDNDTLVQNGMLK